MLLYFAIGAFIFMFLGWFVSSLRFTPVLQLVDFGQSGTAAQIAYVQYQQEVFWRRFILVIFFMASTYFLTGFALRPIRKSVELQQRFFNTVSHELRTPLTVMKNIAQVTLRNPETLTAEKSQHVITSMLEETDRMSQTINFLLSLSSLSIQKRIPDVHILLLTDTVKEALDSLQDQAMAAGVSLILHSEEGAHVRGNPTALRGLVTNLVANALRHTERGGSITADLHVRKRAVHLSITDTGTGIAQEDITYIFEPFYRGKKARTTDHSGFGIGLSLVREVVRLHNGRISVQSEEGKGASFLVVLPRTSLST
jgi:signal transduction histidine kinase